jgi:hypothetical protein
MNLCRVAVLLLVALSESVPVSAQIPFYTDDTGVTEPGTLHVEAFDEVDVLPSSHYPDVRQNTVNLKVNVGLPRGFELDVDAPYLTINRADGAQDSRGVGDLNMGVKWSAGQAPPGSRLPTFAMSFYVEFPTGDARDELGSGLADYWLNFIVQMPVSDQTRFNVNAGILFAGNTSTGVVGIETRRGHVFVGGLSVLHDVSPRFTIGAEVYGGESDTDGLDRTQLQTMLGAQYTIRDGIAVSIGFIVGTYAASPRIGGQIGIAIDFPNTFGTPAHPLDGLTAEGVASRRRQFSARNAGDP